LTPAAPRQIGWPSKTDQLGDNIGSTCAGAAERPGDQISEVREATMQARILLRLPGLRLPIP
jgi:hypothetical protein